MFRNRIQKIAAQEAAIADAIGRPDWLRVVSVSPDGTARLTVAAIENDPAETERRRLAVEAKARSINGIIDAAATVEDVPPAPSRAHTHRQATSEPPRATPPEPETPPERPAPAGGQRITLIGSPPVTPRKRVRAGARLSDEAITQGALPQAPSVDRLARIRRILVVASAKGGVGKSTVSVNLAAAMAQAGMKVGLLDADIYGPSIPTMLGTQNAQPATSADGLLVPVSAHGLQSLSIGYLSDADAPMIWRGPIVMSAIDQMLKDAAWGDPDDPLDLLIIDTPPGTGDAQLAIAQNIPVTAALIVTTPQEVALADVRRGAAMFAKTHVPVLGIVETMSWFEDPSGVRHPIMGEGGGGAMATALGLPLIAQIPMLQALREGGDNGVPAALGEGPERALFHGLARTVAIGIDQLETKPTPEIVFED